MIPRDPGLQAQRSALAWTRTGLSVLVNALLVLRGAAHGESRPLLLLGTGLLFAAAVIVAFGMQRCRHLQAIVPKAPGAGMMLTAVGVTWLACAGAVATVLP